MVAPRCRFALVLMVASIPKRVRLKIFNGWMISEWPKSWLFAVWYVCRLCILDVLARYVGILMSHYKDPYGTNQYNMEQHKGFEHFSIVFMRKSTITSPSPFQIWSCKCHPFGRCLQPPQAVNPGSISFCPPQGSFHGMAKSPTSSGWKLHHQCGRETWQQMVHLYLHTFITFDGKRLFRLRWQKATWRILKVYKL